MEILAEIRRHIAGDAPPMPPDIGPTRREAECTPGHRRQPRHPPSAGQHGVDPKILDPIRVCYYGDVAGNSEV
jgi:hypothetical protein